jgi:hypothetical protein
MLLKLADGQLSEQESVPVEDHLQQCASCAQAYDEHFQSILTGLRGADSNGMPEQDAIDALIVRLESLVRPIGPQFEMGTDHRASAPDATSEGAEHDADTHFSLAKSAGLASTVS